MLFRSLGSVEFSQLQQATWFTPAMWLLGTIAVAIIIRFVSKILKLILFILIIAVGIYYLKTYTTYLGSIGL